MGYPHGARIHFDDSVTHFQSGIFFIEKGGQYTDIDINLQNGKTPVIRGSRTNNLFLEKFHARDIEKEYLGLIEKAQDLYRLYKNEIPESAKKKFFNEREEYYIRRDSFLLSDSRINNSFFISMWLVTENLQSYGYKPQYYEVFNLIPQKLRATKIWNLLSEKISAASSTEIGKIFPSLSVRILSENQSKLVFKTET